MKTMRLPKTLEQFRVMIEAYTRDDSDDPASYWVYLQIWSAVAESISAGYAIHEDSLSTVARYLRVVRREYVRKGYMRKVNGAWQMCATVKETNKALDDGLVAPIPTFED